jgi:hypothetical protein
MLLVLQALDGLMVVAWPLNAFTTVAIFKPRTLSRAIEGFA